jgi:hypothetical protein
VAAAAKIHGEAMNAAVVIPICYTWESKILVSVSGLTQTSC